jgi:hypothetical protein
MVIPAICFGMAAGACKQLVGIVLRVLYEKFNKIIVLFQNKVVYLLVQRKLIV